MPSSVRRSSSSLLPLVSRRLRHRAQQRRDGHLALAVDLDREQILVARLELQPRAAIRDKLGGKEFAARRGILVGCIVDAGRAHELADDDALGAINNKCALARHQREITHEDVFFDDLAGLFIDQARLDVRGAA